jgi:hypothetical protein
MQLDFARNDYFRFEVVAPGTAGMAYDCKIAAAVRCGAFSGTVETWVDGTDVKGFITALNELNATLRGEAILTSDDGRSLTVHIAPLDSLGHYVLKVTMAEDIALGSKTYQSSAAGVFPIEAQALGPICEALIEGVKGTSDA